MKMGFLKPKGRVYHEQLSVIFVESDTVKRVEYESEEAKM
jgi:hypothetical protein